MENSYRPTKLEIKDLENGRFKIVDSEDDDYELATILEFNPENSDLSIEMVREFVEYLTEWHNQHHP